MSDHKPVKCLGLLGRMFGHKFSTIDYHHSHCQRCGMPQGGWTK